MHELAGKRLYLNPERLTGWRITSVVANHARLISLSTGKAQRADVVQLREWIEDGVIHVQD